MDDLYRYCPVCKTELSKNSTCTYFIPFNLNALILKCYIFSKDIFKTPLDKPVQFIAKMKKNCAYRIRRLI